MKTAAVNVDGGKGNVSAAFNTVSGILNASGCTGNAGVMNGSLQIGSISFTGDPTFWSMNGPLGIGGQNTGGQPLTLLSGGDVDLGSSQSYVTMGGALTIVAGAALALTGNPI